METSRASTVRITGVVAAVLAIALALWFAWPAGAPVPGPTAEAGTQREVVGDAVGASNEGAQEARAAGRNERVDVTKEPTEPPEQAAPEPVILKGRLLDARGRGLADAPLALHAFTMRDRYRIGDALGVSTRSDPFGKFEMSWKPAKPGQLVAPIAGEGYRTLRTTFSWRGSASDLVVVAAPSVALEGSVVAEAGAPLAEASVKLRSMELSQFPEPLEETVDLAFGDEYETGADGRFHIASYPLAPGLDLTVRRAGYEVRRVPCMDGRSGVLEITLRKLVAAQGRLSGITMDAVGRPVEEAGVHLGREQHVTSAADGAFELEYPERATALIATRPGYRAVVLENITKDTPVPILVEFREKALAISGSLVDATGTPLPDWCIGLADPEWNRGRVYLERDCSPGHDELPRGALASTDREGRFVIDGLLDRDYRLRAWHPRTALCLERGPIRAGSRDVLLQVPRDATLDELRGVVVDRNGRGVEGAHVWFALVASTWGDIAIVTTPIAKTAADGTFTLRDVPRRHVQVSVSGDELVYVSHEIEQCLDARSVRIEVHRECHIQIEGEVGLGVRFLDAEGGVLTVSSQSQGVGFSANYWRMRSPRSTVLNLAETAVTMVWLRDREEIGRKAITLVPGAGVTTLILGP